MSRYSVDLHSVSLATIIYDPLNWFLASGVELSLGKLIECKLGPSTTVTSCHAQPVPGRKVHQLPGKLLK